MDQIYMVFSLCKYGVFNEKFSEILDEENLGKINKKIYITNEDKPRIFVCQSLVMHINNQRMVIGKIRWWINKKTLGLEDTSKQINEEPLIQHELMGLTGVWNGNGSAAWSVEMMEKRLFRKIFNGHAASIWFLIQAWKKNTGNHLTRKRMLTSKRMIRIQLRYIKITHEWFLVD
jgi:hypothetical protein